MSWADDRFDAKQCDHCGKVGEPNTEGWWVLDRTLEDSGSFRLGQRFDACSDECAVLVITHSGPAIRAALMRELIPPPRRD